MIEIRRSVRTRWVRDSNLQQSLRYGKDRMLRNRDLESASVKRWQRGRSQRRI